MGTAIIQKNYTHLMKANRIMQAREHIPVLDVIIASPWDVASDFCELVVMLGVQLHHQRVFFSSPYLILLDSRIDVVVVALTALLGGTPGHDFRDLGPTE